MVDGRGKGTTIAKDVAKNYDNVEAVVEYKFDIPFFVECGVDIIEFINDAG